MIARRCAEVIGFVVTKIEEDLGLTVSVKKSVVTASRPSVAAAAPSVEDGGGFAGNGVVDDPASEARTPAGDPPTRALDGVSARLLAKAFVTDVHDSVPGVVRRSGDRARLREEMTGRSMPTDIVCGSSRAGTA